MAFTNNLTGLADTNSFLVWQISNPVLANGAVTTIGLPKRYYPTANGTCTNAFQTGFYVATNAYLGGGIVFIVPNDSTATVWDAFTPVWQGGLAASGYNTYNVGIIPAAILDRFATNYFQGNLNTASNYLFAYLTANTLTPLQITNLINNATNIGASTAYVTAAIAAAGVKSTNFSLFIGAQLTNDIVATSNLQYTALLAATNSAVAQAAAYALNLSGYNTNFTRAQGGNYTNLVIATSNSLYTAILAQNVAATNSILAQANAYTLTIGGYGSNNVQAAALRLTNNIVATSNAQYTALLAATNSAVAQAAAYALTISGYNTNFTRAQGGNYTNLVIATSNSLYTTALAQIVAATNSILAQANLYARTVGGAVTNFARLVGAASTNYTDAQLLAATNSLNSQLSTLNTALLAATNNFPLGNLATMPLTNGETRAVTFAGTVEHDGTTYFGPVGSDQHIATDGSFNLGNSRITGDATGLLSVNSISSGGNIDATTYTGAGYYLDFGNLTNKWREDIVATNAATVASIAGKANSTNADLFGQIMFGGTTNVILNTNGFALYHGQAAGGYFGSGGNWTNRFDTRYTIIALAGNYYVQSNGVTLFASGDARTWTPIPPGIAPAPVSAFGGILDFTGYDIRGLLASTNLTAQILALANTNSSGVTSNAVIALIAQYGTNPTNGVTSANVTNIIVSYNYATRTELLSVSNVLYSLATATNVTPVFVTNAVNGLVPALVQNGTVGGIAVGTVGSFTFNTTGSNYIWSIASNATNPIPGWINALGLSVSNDVIAAVNLSSNVLNTAQTAGTNSQATYIRSVANSTSNSIIAQFPTGGSATNAIAITNGTGYSTALVNFRGMTNSADANFYGPNFYFWPYLACQPYIPPGSGGGATHFTPGQYVSQLSTNILKFVFTSSTYSGGGLGFSTYTTTITNACNYDAHLVADGRIVFSEGSGSHFITSDMLWVKYGSDGVFAVTNGSLTSNIHYTNTIASGATLAITVFMSTGDSGTSYPDGMSFSGFITNNFVQTNGQLLVNGNVDATSFTINGQPFQNTIYNSTTSITNLGLSGFVTTNLTVSGADFEPALNGTYIPSKTNANPNLGVGVGSWAVYTNTTKSTAAISLYGYATNETHKVLWFLSTNSIAGIDSFGNLTASATNYYESDNLFGTYFISQPVGMTPYPYVQYQSATNNYATAADITAATNGLPSLVASNGIQLTAAGNTLFIEATGTSGGTSTNKITSANNLLTVANTSGGTNFTLTAASQTNGFGSIVSHSASELATTNQFPVTNSVARMIQDSNLAPAYVYASPTNNGVIDTNAFSANSLIPNFNGPVVPLLGFEDWTLYSATVSEQNLLTVMTNMIRAGYRDAGYNAFLIDEGWSTNRDNSSNLVARANFPSGITGLVQNLHSNGFKAGMFFSLGASAVTGVSTPMNLIEQDATNAAAWGLDFVHLVIDDNGYLTGNGGIDPNYYRYKRFILALQKAAGGKQIQVYGTGHSQEPWMQGSLNGILYAGWPGYADANGAWTNALGFIDGFFARRDFVQPGHYLFHGWLGWQYRGNATDAAANPWQTQALYGTLAMWHSPLFVANEYADIGGFEWIGVIQTNRLMLSIDQDALAIPPLVVSSNNSAQIYYEPLAPAGSGRFAIGILSRDLTVGSKTFSVVWTNFAVAPMPTPQSYVLKDVFGGTNSTVTTNGFTYTVPTNGFALFIVEPSPTVTNYVAPSPVLTNYVSFSTSTANIVPGGGTSIVIDDGAGFISGAIGSSALRVSHGTLELFNWQIPREKLCGTNIDVVSCFITTGTQSPTLPYSSRVACMTDAGVGTLVGSVSLTKLLTSASTKYWVTNHWTITTTNATVFVIAGSGNAFTPTNQIDLLEQGVIIYP